MFSVLREDELDSVLRDIENQLVPAGQQLFGQGQHGLFVYTVRSGCVKMVHALEDGTSRIVRLHHAGDAVGLESLLGEAHRHAAIVLEKADVCRIPVGVIRALNQRNPQLFEQLERRWQKSLDEAESFITQLNTGHAESRLARLLLKLDGYTRDHQILNPMRDDIAAIIGVTTETASRVMADFRRRNLIVAAENSRIRCNVEALKQLL